MGRGLRLATLLVVFFNAGCSVPPHMQITEGLSPQGQDEEVRFRTTYYFRTFDLCDDDSKPRNDSLYRFRLTGKANALTNAVNFEAGTLLASQIDPFGASIAFDSDNRQFYFKSQEQVRQDALRNEHYADFDRLFQRYEKAEKALQNIENEEAKNIQKKILAKLEKALTDRLSALSEPKEGVVPEDEYSRALTELFDKILAYREAQNNLPKNKGGNLLELPKSRDGISYLIQGVKSSDRKIEFYEELSEALKEPDFNFYCSDDPQRGYQVLGPQGSQLYDQESRLIFAMSSSGKPLINTLQELSGRILNSDRPVDVNNLTQLVREEIAAEEALAELKKFNPDNPDAAEGLLTTTRNQFSLTELEATEAGAPDQGGQDNAN